MGDTNRSGAASDAPDATTPKDPGISKAEFLRTAERRIAMWVVAMLLAVLQNAGALATHLCEGKVDQGAVSGTLASVYLVTALGYFEARYVNKLAIPEPKLRRAFACMGWTMWVAAAACCVLSWSNTGVLEELAWRPRDWTWRTTVAICLATFALVAELFLAAQYVHWGKGQTA